MTRDEARSVIAFTLAMPMNPPADEARMDDLGADSLDYIELALAIEMHNNCEIPDEDIAKWVTVGDVINSAVAVTA